MVLVAFVAAAAMVLLVLLAESDQAAGTQTGTRTATSLTHDL
jgi:hypothetical protein